MNAIYPFKTKEIMLETTISEVKEFLESELRNRKFDIKLFVEANAKGNKLIMYPNQLTSSEGSQVLFRERFGKSGTELTERLLKEFLEKEVSCRLEGEKVFISLHH